MTLDQYSAASPHPYDGAEPPAHGLGLVHEHERSLVLNHDGAELARYVYRPWETQLESPRPYFHPLRTLGGDLVSLYRPHDHVWHKGIAWSLPNVGSANFWGGPTYLRDGGYQQLDNNGATVHRGFDYLTVTADRVAVGERLHWLTQQGQTWFTEQRAFSATVDTAQQAWTLVFETTFTNRTDDTIPLGSPTTEGRDNAGYGGLFWRGPRSFTGGKVYSPHGVGGDDLMGVRAPWLAFAGQHDGCDRAATLVFVNAPDNPDSPPQWFVRSGMFACVCPAPFFSSVVEAHPDTALTYRYAVVVADGDRGNDGAAHLAETGRVELDQKPILPEVSAA